MTRSLVLLPVVVVGASCTDRAPPPVVAIDAGGLDSGPGEVAAAAPLEEDERAWFTASADGAAVLRQKGSADQCYLTCEVADAGLVWDARSPCMAERHALRFVAPDCGKTVVLIPAPDRGRPWAQTEVMRVYTRGTLRYAVMGVTVLPEKRMRTSTTWLKGTYDVPGERPGYTADGTGVHFESLDGKATVVPLVGDEPAEDAPPPPRKRPKRR